MNRAAFENLVASLPDAVFVLRIPERHITYCNRAAEALFGYTQEQFIGSSTRLLHVDDAHFDAFHAATHPVLTGGHAYRGEFAMRKRNGEIFATQHSISLFEDDAGAEFAVSVIRDITAERDQSRLVQESEGRFRAIAENLREVFWISTADKTRMEYVSPAYEGIWMRPVAELYADPNAFTQAIIPDDRERVLAELPKQPSGGYDVEYRIEQPDGSQRWIWDRAVPVRGDNGQVLRIVGIAEDITALKQRESELAQAQKMEALGRLTGGIAHDFNNMLTVILGNAELLVEDDGANELSTEILEAARRASDLTKQLLAFARQRPLRMEQVDVNTLIRETAGFLRRTLGEDVTVELDLAPDAWPVHTDTAQLGASLVNLAVNARDAMPSGGRLQVVTRNRVWSEVGGLSSGELVAGDYLVIEVRDTGVGMAPEVASRVFEPFFTTKPLGKGTGLGLPTVFGFIKGSGGHIDVTSAPTRGSTFTLYLPRGRTNATV